MIFRHANINDLDQIAKIEKICFTPAEAATKSAFADRLKIYPNHFYVAEENGNIIACVNGFVTDEPDLTDEMYEKAQMHNENGKWQMIFGVTTLPKYRSKGIATKLLQNIIFDARKQGRKGVVLTCRDKLVTFYKKFGFVDEDITDKSTHGNISWHQMRLTF